MSPFEIPVGVHVYTSDGVDAGVISSVAAKHFVVRTADGTAVAQIATTISATRSLEITAALLNGIVGSLLTLLLGGETVYAYVETIHASGWRSAPTPIKGIKSSGLLSGLLGGVACA